MLLVPQIEPLTDDEFGRVCRFIHKKSGIVLTMNKKNMVYNRLLKRLRDCNIDNFSDYLRMLEREPLNAEWQAFVNALTTNLTAFFREPHHFATLTDFLKSRRNSNVNIWCAASSTGEEPYSIAMTISDVLGANAVNSKVVASDIDTEVLEKAKQGIYRVEELKTLTALQRQRYFMKGVGEYEGFARVKPALSNMIEFRYLNLTEGDWQLQHRFDAIFCRNVMIYFDKEMQIKLLERFAPLLKPDGLLFIGHSENISQLTKQFVINGQTVYSLASARRGQ
ncbi:TPA: chemotaxis protein-glutamate O-methyltransferase [Providencia alcalifaciens]|uniref:Chemotaxis protein methyltransferase n=3 Tax=Providencia alcalifaciens TaxID=126385 RepID=A0AAW9VG62_9GAMM|nr:MULTISPECIES: chemotaxis protein-glutamate O-methyltransferase [Providencia]ATG17868.1 chemotaxis protein-glutamate O-methyltransferase [Providencia alcalifaciens]EEB47341.1 CheR methyltransferase, SAM binding domain protein [Providencia alcalifaciens DSM 30120]MBF0690585.1 chemotaxis protein-glutamate O-methyltransferase [Providencia alcalifaciens]MTB34533.1 chemotaxis protein-glutamate O-methyltransferase [Providencia alcalifaciens]MTC17377.1 chemotaxis protein-glutamate O-methyltransfera